MEARRPTESASVHAHKRQLAWQILVPLLLATALIIAAAVLIVTGAVSASRTFADISITWLIAPMLVFGLIFIILLGFLIYAIAKLLQGLPRFTGKVQNFLARVASWTRGFSNAALQPFIWLQQAGAIIKSIFKS